MTNTRNVICCVTCAVMNPTVAGVWNNSWDICKPDEEMQAFEHAQDNPQHIMVRAWDFAVEVNGA